MEEYPQHLYTRYPKRRLQDFPNELLLNIFRLGCDHSEIKPRTDYAFDSPPHPRKRKHFIAAVRLVCYRWQKLVDLPSLPYGPHFWFARISLSLRDPLEPFATSFVDTNSFIRRLGDFRSRLSSSKGCDLVIEVDTGGVATPGDHDDDHPGPENDFQGASPEHQQLIRLFLPPWGVRYLSIQNTITRHSFTHRTSPTT